MYIEKRDPWEAANTLCCSASRGKADLVSIQSQDENDHVESLQLYKDGLNAWLGGYLTSNGSYAWRDGSTFEYSNWASGLCDFSVSPSPFGLELWTLDLGLTKRYIVFFIALGGGLGGGNKCYIFFSLFFRKRPLERHQTLT